MNAENVKVETNEIVETGKVEETTEVIKTTEVVETQNKEKKKKTRKKPSKKLIIIFVVVFVIIGAIVIGSIMTKGQAGGLPVPTVKAGYEDISSEIQISGIVTSEEIKTYFAPVTGIVDESFVTEGQEVKQGTILIGYDLSNLESDSQMASLTAEAERYGIDASIITLNKQASDYAKAVTDYDTAMAYVNHWTQCLEASNYEYSIAMGIKTQYEEILAQVNAWKIKKGESANPNEELDKLIAQGEKELKELEKQMEPYDYIGLAGSVETCQKELAEYKALAEQYKAQKIENPALGSQKKQQQVLKEINSIQQNKSDDELIKARNGVTADFSGIVTDVSFTEGQPVAQGSALFRIQSTENVKVIVELSKYDLEKIQIGQKADITINGNPYEGTVSSISRVATTNANGAAVVKAEIHIDNPDENLFLGIEAKVKIECETVKNAMTLPLTCVNYDTKGSFCYVVENGVIKRREVVTGLSSDHSVQVLEGVDSEDEVITEVTELTVEGANVVSMPEGAEEDTKETEEK